MANTWKFYADAGLTTELASLDLPQSTGGPAAETVIWFGSIAAGKQARNAADPGTDPIVLSVVDANSGAGLPATAIKLALTYAGLASATPGASVTLGTTLNSGAANKVAVYVRADSGASAPQTFTDLSLQTSTLLET